VLTGRPLDEDEFSRLMEGVGPFEQRPRLAVAVSGGADSLALTVLADRWARARDGAVIGVTVDHGLRPAAAAEARQVADWLAVYGIAHQTLPWTGSKPTHGVQAAARVARYALLESWCAEQGILHLLLAHHQNDQAETVLARLARGSGVDGLSAMASISEGVAVRRLRPLLSVPHMRLIATLERLGQAWIEDPSNTSDHYQRVRLRHVLEAEGGEAARLAATARHLSRARHALEHAAAELMAEVVTLHPAGFAMLDSSRLASAEAETGLRLLAGLCRTIGGRTYPPRLERLERLYDSVCAGLPSRRTFCGCVLAPKGSIVLVCREPAAVGDVVEVTDNATVRWDDRFTLRFTGVGRAWVTALGRTEWRADKKKLRPSLIPRPAQATLPAVVDQHGVSAVPHLGYKRETEAGRPVGKERLGELLLDSMEFTPLTPLTGVGHCLV
jgi:tRNA(Ile)-lysidine synthase